MSNLFKRAALALGRFTGLNREPQSDPQLALIEPVAEAMTQGPADPIMEAPIVESPVVESSVAAIDEEIEQSTPNLLLPLETTDSLWGDALDSTAPAIVAPDAEAAIVTGQIFEPIAIDATPAPDQPVEAIPVGFISEPLLSSTDFAAAPQSASDPVVPVEEPKPSISFTQLYELIANEVNKRTDNAVVAYERMLAAAREEIESTRRNNRLAWSVGGVMTAITAMGAVWAAGEVSATRVELTNLKQQASFTQQASAERDLLRTQLAQAREATAKLEIDVLKTRLDQALSVTAERDRLRAELETARKANAESQLELRLARETKSPATQPVSQAYPAPERLFADKMVIENVNPKSSEDVWSMLLNGREGR
jgi:hypothetical protein